MSQGSMWLPDECVGDEQSEKCDKSVKLEDVRIPEHYREGWDGEGTAVWRVVEVGVCAYSVWGGYR